MKIYIREIADILCHQMHDPSATKCVYGTSDIMNPFQLTSDRTANHSLAVHLTFDSKKKLKPSKTLYQLCMSRSKRGGGKRG